MTEDYSFCSTLEQMLEFGFCTKLINPSSRQSILTHESLMKVLFQHMHVASISGYKSWMLKAGFKYSAIPTFVVSY